MRAYRMSWPKLSRHVIAVASTLLILRLSLVAFEGWQRFAGAHLALSAKTLDQLQLWTLLTHALIPQDFGALFFNLFALYLFGEIVLVRMRARQWYATLATGALMGGLVTALALWLSDSPTHFGGFAAPTMAIIAAYCWSHWEDRLLFFIVELKGKVLLAGFLGLDLLMALLTQSATMLLLHLGGAAAGLIVAGELWRPGVLRRRIANYRKRRRLRLVPRAPERRDAKHNTARRPSKDKRKRPDGTWIN